MRMVANSNKKIALLIAIFLAVFSTGMVIAFQCHSMTSNQVAIQHDHSDHGSVPTAAIKSPNATSNTERLIDSGCAALFVVILLFGRKLLDFRVPKSRLDSFMTLSRELVMVNRPQVFQLALSRPQLGVIRI